MAIISFWNDGKTEAGKTSSMAIIATFLAIKSNLKILLFNTKYDDTSLEDCFWDQSKKSVFPFANKTKIDMRTGITGLIQAIASNKTSPEIITNYTKTVFTNRLEILSDEKIVYDDYKKQRNYFKQIAKIADKYYDLIFVDVEGDLSEETTNNILQNSSLIIINMTPRLKVINNYMELKRTNSILQKENAMVLLNKYDPKSKYNPKNISRYMKEKINSIPYNSLFADACNEGQVTDYIMKFERVKPTDVNALFINSVIETSNKITDKLKELQMKSHY